MAWARSSRPRVRATRPRRTSTSAGTPGSSGSCCATPHSRSSDAAYTKGAPEGAWCGGAGLLLQAVVVQPRGGVDGRAAVGVDLEVKVRTRGVTGVARQSHVVAGSDLDADVLFVFA